MPSLQIMYRHYRSFHLAEKVNTFPSTPQCRMHFRTKSNFPKYPSLSAFAHTASLHSPIFSAEVSSIVSFVTSVILTNSSSNSSSVTLLVSIS